MHAFLGLTARASRPRTRDGRLSAAARNAAVRIPAVRAASGRITSVRIAAARNAAVRIAALPLAASAVLAGLPAATANAQSPPAVHTPEIRMLSWNICGEAGGLRGDAGYCPYRAEPAAKVEQVRQLVRKHRANVVMLQEVCGYAEGGRAAAAGSHMDLLGKALGAGWSIRHAAGARPDGRTDCRGGLTGDLGVLVAVRGEITSARAANTLPPDPAGTSLQTLPALCVTVRGWRPEVCTAHLVVGEDDPADPGARAPRQVAEVVGFLGDAVRSGAVLGGDFNRNGGSPVLAALNERMERCVDDVTRHGWDPATGTHSWHRLDHFYATKAATGSRYAWCGADTSRMDTTANDPASGAPDGYSDHAPILGVVPGGPDTEPSRPGSW
ncbi:endonuclease/exonuclease/phosphatase family protein [Streptomyces sp. NPDC051940]|uniref:endonuclease/exonuclease/phosphatase family protein n=1 Tax=Streptomyces sp. NPDC051940 TaxID=3155675 RepID=UPI003439EF59